MASLWVAAYHLLLPAAFIGGLPARVIGRGYLAVDLFFVLSGFVIALTYGGMFAGRLRLGTWTAFLWRRLARLYPLYGAILLARLAYTALRYRTFDLERPWIAAPLPHPWTDIPANLLLLQSWGLAPSSIGPAWSISTEWAAYVVFPLLAVVMLHGSPRAALMGALASLGLLLATAALLHQHGAPMTLDAWDGRTLGPVMRCLAGFTIGLGVWRLSRRAAVAWVAGHPAAPWAVLVCLATLLVADAPDLVIYPCLPALVLCLSVSRGRPAGLFAWPVLLWLGEISYALYLLHIFLLHPLDVTRAALRLVLAPLPADVLSAGLVLLFLLAAADLCHRWIEVPGRLVLAGKKRVLF